MNIQPVKTAIVECGVISDAYLNTMINRFKTLDVVGCCDHNPEKANTIAQKYGIKVLTIDGILADESLSSSSSGLVACFEQARGEVKGSLAPVSSGKPCSGPTNRHHVAQAAQRGSPE